MVCCSIKRAVMSEARAQPAELDKGYERQAVEAPWPAQWEKQGFFRAQDQSERSAFCIVLPPPNETGSLHLGHASPRRCRTCSSAGSA